MLIVAQPIRRRAGRGRSRGHRCSTCYGINVTPHGITNIVTGAHHPAAVKRIACRPIATINVLMEFARRPRPIGWVEESPAQTSAETSASSAIPRTSLFVGHSTLPFCEWKTNSSARFVIRTSSPRPIWSRAMIRIAASKVDSSAISVGFPYRPLSSYRYRNNGKLWTEGALVARMITENEQRRVPQANRAQG